MNNVMFGVGFGLMMCANLMLILNMQWSFLVLVIGAVYGYSGLRMRE